MRTFGALALVFVLSSCSAPGTGEGVVVSMSEFGIEVEGQMTAGPTTVTVRNDGEFAHTLVVSDSDGHVLFASDVLDSGQATDVDLDLSAGEYELSCRIVVETGDGHLVDHYAEGMVTHVHID